MAKSVRRLHRPGSLKDGWNQLARDVDRAIVAASLSPNETQMLLTVREACWVIPSSKKKKNSEQEFPAVPCRINISALSKEVERSREVLSRAMASLVAKNILNRLEDGSVLINKDYTTWVRADSTTKPKERLFSKAQLKYIWAAKKLVNDQDPCDDSVTPTVTIQSHPCDDSVTPTVTIQSHPCDDSVTPTVTIQSHPCDDSVTPTVTIQSHPCDDSVTPTVTIQSHPHIEVRARGIRELERKREWESKYPPTGLASLPKAEDPGLPNRPELDRIAALCRDWFPSDPSIAEAVAGRHGSFPADWYLAAAEELRTRPPAKHVRAYYMSLVKGGPAATSSGPRPVASAPEPAPAYRASPEMVAALYPTKPERNGAH